MKSCLYFGEVSHHRKSPKRHDLRYKLFMPHLFLDELDQVFQGRFFWSLNRKNLSSFQRSDYHKPEIDAVLQRHAETQDLSYALGGHWREDVFHRWGKQVFVVNGGLRFSFRCGY